MALTLAYLHYPQAFNIEYSIAQAMHVEHSPK